MGVPRFVNHADNHAATLHATTQNSSCPYYAHTIANPSSKPAIIGGTALLQGAPGAYSELDGQFSATLERRFMDQLRASIDANFRMKVSWREVLLVAQSLVEIFSYNYVVTYPPSYVCAE